jgi:hypothetical protein
MSKLLFFLSFLGLRLHSWEAELSQIKAISATQALQYGKKLGLFQTLEENKTLELFWIEKKIN